MKTVAVAFLIFFLAQLCESAKILYVMPFYGKSHYISQIDLPLELARRGHEVYAITMFNETDAPKNYHVVPFSFDEEKWINKFNMDPNPLVLKNLPFLLFIAMTTYMSKIATEEVFQSEDIQKFLEEDHKFDVVICEVFFMDAMYMLAHKYSAPLVLLTTFGNSFRTNYYNQNPLQLATLHHEYGVVDDPFNFHGRLKNFVFSISHILLDKLFHIPLQQSLALKYIKNLPEPVPRLDALAGNAALVLMNNHFTLDVPAAYLPNFIEVGGLSLKESKPLPEDLQKICDEAKEGIVYMNFGSIMKAKYLDENTMRAFLEVFRNLNQTVMMKWEENTLENLPKNVITRKWYPQRDLLAHPNVKAFITHGGLIGLTESVISGVPIIGMPIFADQQVNIVHAKRLGCGEILHFEDLNETNLRNTLHKVLNDATYIENVRAVAKRFEDRPMNGLDTAVWWVEYVIRHKGAKFMKTPALQLSFIANQMWDVYSFLIVLIGFSTFVTVKLGKIAWRKISRKNKLKQQ